MVYNVRRGGNYGWSVMEGPQLVHAEGRRGPTPILPPVKCHPHSEAASITGGYVYHGTRLSELAGAYIYGDFQTGLVWGLRFQADTVLAQELARSPVHLVAFGEASDNELYLLDHDRTEQIYRLGGRPDRRGGPHFPRRLSQTGLFASTRNHRPAAGGDQVLGQLPTLVRRCDRRALAGRAGSTARSSRRPGHLAVP